jgi:hypothetical protein
VIVKAVKFRGVSFEMVFGDDGSSDGAGRISTELAGDAARVRAVKFRYDTQG